MRARTFFAATQDRVLATRGCMRNTSLGGRGQGACEFVELDGFFVQQCFDEILQLLTGRSQRGARGKANRFGTIYLAAIKSSCDAVG